MVTEIIINAGVFAVAYAGARLFGGWSRRRGILDVPNERSLHLEPTPRGGGIVVVFIGLIFYASYGLYGGGELSRSYFAGAILVAVISWLDDLYTVSVSWRLLAQAAAAALVVAALFADADFWVGGALPIKVLAALLIFLWIVGLTNAYNFMDGIDGIAGLQTVVAGIVWLFAGTLLQMPTVRFYGGVLAFASLGFLFQNWQPAKIFLGDVGSAFLGFTLAVLPILAAREAARPFDKIGQLFVVAAAVCWLFLFDTIFTFARRALGGEKVWQPHRTHLYQRLVTNGFSHGATAIIYGAAAVVTGSLAVAGLSDAVYNRWLLAAAAAESVILLVFLNNFEKTEKN